MYVMKNTDIAGTILSRFVILYQTFVARDHHSLLWLQDTTSERSKRCCLWPEVATVHCGWSPISQYYILVDKIANIEVLYTCRQDCQYHGIEDRSTRPLLSRNWRPVYKTLIIAELNTTNIAVFKTGRHRVNVYMLHSHLLRAASRALQ